MPEPKQSKRTYEANVESALDGLRLVQPRSSQPENGQPPAAPRRARLRAVPETGQPELVNRLIDFIKKI